MAARSQAEETSERKRISIPKADESVLTWWEKQNDVGLSVRMLIRNEIERNGYVDVAFAPVAQLPRRGRPPGSGPDAAEAAESEAEPIQTPAAPVHLVAATPAAHPAPIPQLQPVERAPQPSTGGADLLDAIIGG
ncbi:hypothetical protein ACFVU2_19225 [Leifsonia sp. NPDC058194]|uniref:hypothetical protein n=1 Tax=Leifsonia sp. NPDC058194 TaxID=3346374 RepID=UPI0036DA7967